MSAETLHHDALIETARLELDRAHRAVLAVEAGEIRRGVALAVVALKEADADGLQSDPAGEGVIAGVLVTLARVQDDLDNGALVELGNLLEAARKQLSADC